MKTPVRPPSDASAASSRTFLSSLLEDTEAAGSSGSWEVESFCCVHS